ncbi:TonB-dependent receptor [Reichenbachiella agarivorans]|uniref:TonB-dependent receptor n=1 Tax=Reichenbachiella agarivorans TaxID=2979464 RepID=A0ABY6CNK3_9BACT|nr:TonB-dependent receptor [Reichenbachiella agarivorans]UXP32067.1 TonB-dependent receptor [Reichenbachiella agarivorans]
MKHFKTLRFILFFSSLLISCFSFSYAQVQLSGQTIDEQGFGVPFSNIAVLSVVDSSIVNGGVSDFDGNFKMNVPVGEYHIRLSYIGYKTLLLDHQNLSANLDLGKITLQSDVKRMEEVVIESRKYDVEVRPGVKAFNVGASPASESSNALDMLQNIPSTSVGLDDEVSFRGRKVAIFIDGVESDVANILEQIPASEIESIEVISTPSAKYDVKSGESIINVVLKKGKRQGTFADATLGVGNDNFKRANANAKWRMNQFEIGGGTNQKWDTSLDNGDSYRTSYQGDTTQQDQLYRGSNDKYDQYYHFKTQYRMNEDNLIQLSASTGINNFDREKNFDVIYSDDEVVDMTLDRSRVDEDQRHWFWGNFLFKQSFREGKSELRARVKYGYSDKDEEFVFLDSTYNADGSFREVSRLDRVSDQMTGDISQRYSLDYEHGLGENYRIEVGAALWLRNSERIYDYYSYDENAEWEQDTGRSNQYIYSERVSTAYSQFNGKMEGFESLSYSLGLRAEHTSLDPHAVGIEENYLNQYWRIMPSVQLAYQMDESQSLSFNYSTRNKAPSQYRLNPFVTYYSPTAISYGNPYLKPESINALELSHDKTWNGDQVYLSNSIYYKRVKDADIHYRFEDENEIVNFTYTNVDAAASLGWELIANFKPIEKLRINTSMNLSNAAYTTYTSAQEQLRRRGTNFSTKSSLEYQLAMGFSTQLTMNYFSQQLTAQGYNEPYYFADLVMRQKLWDDKLSVSVKFADLLHSWERNSVVDQSDTFESANTYERNSVRYYLTVTYRFSKLKWGTES